MKDINFTKTPGFLIEFHLYASPYDYFRLLLDDDLLELIVDETNKYAETIFLSEGAVTNSRISRCNL
ncbi:unnamed protein product [Acanthoscelides obtectus]|uniref:PiggyBac transposable element-derived protein domain-containing protein n=1 Tax=Acanthoscelides obtectus TaxID=200917 RepID=A0A9P0L7V2_ACAOB|nr:unnamed protein product [Acanthoscelides obtectus]CAH2009103.1 unnamed protein product [Acanthoscelides obtectus]CAH2013181.1 unnamed protein product [Acanthoscelides obtectus]CAK1630543.1 hypothetical protein AOBTE_LOCUS6396 [Acanthoscelides obtectus]CAK1630600.1 hypothetical protein AOBTE_LOCUS6436 [Acanthoscelides obtectus]